MKKKAMRKAIVKLVVQNADLLAKNTKLEQEVDRLKKDLSISETWRN